MNYTLKNKDKQKCNRSHTLGTYGLYLLPSVPTSLRESYKPRPSWGLGGVLLLKDSSLTACSWLQDCQNTMPFVGEGRTIEMLDSLWVQLCTEVMTSSMQSHPFIKNKTKVGA